MRTRVDRSGRVVIPLRMLREMGIEPGGEVVIQKQGGFLVLHPLKAPLSLVVRRGVLVCRGRARGNLQSAVKRDRTERMRRLMGGLDR